MNTVSSWEQSENDIDLIEFLMSTPKFNMLSDDELEMLDRIMCVDTYPGAHKFKSDVNIYLIIDGEVAVTHKRNSGIMQLDRMYAGKLFGLFSLIDDSMQSATCRAVGSVRAASIPRAAFELLFKSNLPLADHFRHILSLTHDVA